MFNFSKARRNYKQICSDPNLVHKILYIDRRETAKILGDETFISAWLDSDKQRDITMLIRKEAMDGDIPSLKQMVWLLGMLYEEILHSNLDKKTKSQALIGQLEERIAFCNQLTLKGFPQSYYAMISCHRLYQVLHDLKEPGSITKTRDTLNQMVQHAEAVIKMGKDHPDFDGDAGFIQDATNMLSEGKDLRSLLNALGDSVSTLDGRRLL